MFTESNRGRTLSLVLGTLLAFGCGGGDAGGGGGSDAAGSGGESVSSSVDPSTAGDINGDLRRHPSRTPSI